MKKNVNWTKLIEYLLGILATGMIVIGLMLYMIQEPDRIASAQDEQLSVDLDEAMTLYAQNCAVCHGLSGEGIGAAPALDREALRQTEYSVLEKIIGRGLYGTAMPAWSKEDGGPFGDYQIGELVSLIQFGDWDATRDRVVNLGLAPLVPFTTEPDPEIIAALQSTEGNEQFVEGIDLYAELCVACHGADGTGTALAPALNDPTVREQMPEELTQTILNGVPGTLMVSWDKSLDGEAADALVALLKNWDQIPSGAIPAPNMTVPVTAESLVLGEELYSSNCSSCHGPEGQGTPRAPALNVKSFLVDTNDVAIQQIVTLGVPGTAMPAWGDRMTDAQIQAIVGFIRAWEPNAPEVAEPARGGGPWWQTDGNFAPGSGSGGPPWRRNDSSTSSGGTNILGVEGQTGMFNSAVQPNFAVQSATRPDGQTSAEKTAAQVAGDHQASGYEPPWQQEQPKTTWWSLLDWRVKTLVVVGLFAVLSLVSVGLFLLLRLPRPA